jgi:hypothetical protein
VINGVNVEWQRFIRRKEVPDGFDDVWKGEKNLDSIMLCLTKNKQEKRNHDV